MSAKLPCGWIGLGAIGTPMALRLRQAGFPMAVWNRSPGKDASLIAAGATAATTPAELASRSQLVMLCVSDTDSVEEVVFGPDGVASAGRLAGKVLIDHSSIRPGATREFAAQLKADTGMAWVDAPVSGGVGGAERGELAVMAGGASADVERAREAIMAYARRLTRMGPVGAGQVTKLCNQILVVAGFATIAETLALAAANGVDPLALPAALAGGYADSALLQAHAARMATAEFRTLGGRGTLLKDIDTATALGRESMTALPMAATAAELFRLLRQQGHDDVDPAAVVRLYAAGALKPRDPSKPPEG